MYPLTKEFIKNNSSLINREDWKPFYEELNKPDIDYKVKGEINKVLLDSGINPLLNFDRVPSYFLEGADFEDFKIPEGVKYIIKNAIHNSSIGVLYLPNSLLSIDESAFNTSSIYTLMYNGTKEEWGEIMLELEWDLGIRSFEVHCIDGVVDIR